jgi:4-methyl-5(b-hydroxyethyl)-thiazole monophosphate biosynthesis
LITTGLRPIIKCYWNLIVQPELPFDQIDVDDFDALAIPGGAGDAGFYEDAYDDRFLNLIREFDEKGKLIASVCVGALPIGKSGILKNRKATTWDLNEGVRRKQLADFGAIVQDKQLVVDQNIITSTGPATSLDVAFKLLEMLTDIQNVNEIKRNMRFILD